MINQVKDKAPVANYYDLLGVNPASSRDEIRDAYHARIRLIHPDRNRGDPEAQKWTQQLNAAWEVLSDPEKRAAYDRENGVGSYVNGSAAREPKQGNHRGNAQGDIDEIEVDISLEWVERGYRGRLDGIWVNIPPGVENGERILIEGRGIHLIIVIKPHNHFTRRGADLYTKLTIRKVDVLNRKRLGVSTLSSWVDFNLKEEVLGGERICLPGYGLPFRHNPQQRGALYVECEVKPIPEREVEVTLTELDRGFSRRFADLGEVKIPPGVAIGSRIYVYSMSGKEANLLIKLAPDTLFTRRGDDLHAAVHVNYAALLLRLSRRLHIGDRAVNVRLRPEYANGQRVRLAGQGLPNVRDPRQRGDLYVTFVTDPWQLPVSRPTSRWERLANFAHGAMLGTLKAAGIVNNAVQKAMTAYHNFLSAVHRNWNRIRIALIVLGILVGLALIGWLIYFIIVNIVTILIVVGVAMAAIVLLRLWLMRL